MTEEKNVDIKFSTYDMDELEVTDLSLDEATDYVSRVLSSDWFDDNGLVIDVKEHKDES